MKYLFLLAILSLSLQSCISSSSDNVSKVSIAGTITKQGITTYQYGTHVIGNSDSFYALRSSTIELDDYVNQFVTITGNKVSGYPVDGGPEYLEVIEVKQ